MNAIRTSRRRLAAAAVATLLATGAAIGMAHAGDRHDHDQARRALEAGEVMPLRTLLDRVERDYPGQVLEVELDREDDLWAYEITVLRTGGKVVRLKLDGKTGAVLSIREPRRHGDHHGAER